MNGLLHEFLSEISKSLDSLILALCNLRDDPDNAENIRNIRNLMADTGAASHFLGLKGLRDFIHALEDSLEAVHGKERSCITEVVAPAIIQIKTEILSLQRRQICTGDDPVGVGVPTICDAEILLDEKEKTATLTVSVEKDSVHGTSGENSILDGIHAEKQAEKEDGADDSVGRIEEKEEQKTEGAGNNSDVIERSGLFADNASTGDCARTHIPYPDQTIRVNISLLERLMTLVGELVLNRNRLLGIINASGNLRLGADADETLRQMLSVICHLQEDVMKVRLQPINKVWGKLPSAADHISLKLGKRVQIVMEGGSTKVDQRILEAVKDPLIHMLRNAIYHGLETPEERISRQKNPVGRITLDAQQRGGFIFITMSDDGSGLDMTKIRQTILKKNYHTEDELDQMNEAQIQQFIFSPGFSTASGETEISGRGIGMDIVRANIEAVQGSIELESVSGEGLKVTLKIPLILSVIGVLLVEVREQYLAIPQSAVVELVKIRYGYDSNIQESRETKILKLRNEAVPLIDLGSFLEIRRASNQFDADNDDVEPVGKKQNGAFVVIVQIGASNVGLIVDELFHTEETIARPLPRLLRHVSAFSGSVILDNGCVVPVLDLDYLERRACFSRIVSELSEISPGEKKEDRSIQIPMLAYESCSGVLQVVPLSLIVRVEQFDPSLLQEHGENYTMSCGVHIPLVLPDDWNHSCPDMKDSVLIFSDHGRNIGLVVGKVIGIVYQKTDIEMVRGRRDILGLMHAGDSVVELLDVNFALEKHFCAPSGNSTQYVPHVLLIDPSSFCRNMLSATLQSHGFFVKAVSSLEECRILKESQRHFDFILCDIQILTLGGLEFVHEARNTSQWKDSFLIGLTPDGDKEVASRFLSSGFSACVTKFDCEGLLTLMQGGKPHAVRVA